VSLSKIYYKEEVNYMPIGYTTNTWMKHVNAQENRQFAEMVLAHDPKMISQIYNYDLELVKPIIDKSITYLNRMNFLRAKDHKELAKILSYAYKANRAFRKQLFVALARLMDDEGRRWWNTTIEGEFNINDYAELFYDMFLYDPLYILTVKPGLIKTVLDFNNKTFADYLLAIRNKDIAKLVDRKLENKSSRNYYNNDRYTKYNELKDNITGFNWGPDSMFCKTLDEKIDELTELSGELDEKFSSALLYLKLTL
jgi:hypothetical protein